MAAGGEFLSDEWISALAARLAEGGRGSSPKRLVIQYLIDTDRGPVAYHLELGPDTDTAGPGSAPAPDVTFSMNEQTAREISQGTLSAEEAFLTGRLDIAGDTSALVEAHRAARDA